MWLLLGLMVRCLLLLWLFLLVLSLKGRVVCWKVWLWLCECSMVLLGVSGLV